MSAPRIAIVATHPIQYYAPVFRTLTERGRVNVRVFYGWAGGSQGATFDPGFGQSVEWDIPLLDGYDYTFLPNESTEPGTHHFSGIWSEKLVPSIADWSPDALMVYGWNYRSHLRVLRAFHGRVPILFRGDSNLLDIPWSRRVSRYLMLRWIYRHVDLALYVGSRNREYYERYGLRGDKLQWAPHAVENRRFSDPDGSIQQRARDWRVRLGIPRRDLVFAYAGKLERKKAPDLLLDVFMERDRPGQHLVIAGSGELESQLRAKAGSRTNIHFLGFQNQSSMAVVYRLADVFVMPSRGPNETWGLAVNEAMASERPVIACDRVGCSVDLVLDGKTGFTFQRDDAAGLNRSLTMLAKDAELRANMAQAAKTLIAQWTIEEQAARIEAAVESVLDR
ncbi:MAG: glycosyltransferase family 4 protein [Gemmatimonadaceae bacterium]